MRCEHFLIFTRGIYKAQSSVADPGFSVGGGGVDLRRGHFSVKMYVKTKELGPMGGVCLARLPLDLPMIMMQYQLPGTVYL